MTTQPNSPPAPPAPPAPPPPPPAPGAAAAELNSPPPPPPFYDSFTDAETKDWAAKAKFESPEAVAKLARKFDAFKDADPANLILAPGADAKPEDHMGILKRLGAPEDATAYGLDKIEGVDAALASAAQGWFKDAGILPWQAQIIAEKQMAHMKETEERLVGEDNAAAARELADLKTKEWAGKYDQNRELARRGLKAAGVDDKTIDYLQTGMGAAAVLKLGAFIGSRLREGEFIDGERGAQPAGLLERLYPKDVAKDRGQA